jgi:hypothetical protein
MKRSLLTAWFTALRSGEYEQTRDGLLGHDNKRCCLGVLLDVAKVPVEIDPQSGIREYTYNGDVARLCLPQAFADEVGMIDNGSPVHIPIGEEDCLAEMNDGGTRFEVIADRIEAEPLKYIRTIEEDQ